ncbi:MAG: galactokinase [Verrucomicrobia bacterium]|nr:galactokinase [Verrucomicrobiota bacterium]
MPSEAFSSACGRLEVLGNHTDYNQGLVLAMGVRFTLEVLGKKRNDEQLILHAMDLGQKWEGSLASLSPHPRAGWANYVLGVLQGLKNRGIKLSGLELELSSHLPMGAGLSSSAALTVATQRCLQSLWGFTMPALEMAKISQEAEHRHAGVKCGLLDPMAILHAKKDYLVLIDFRSMEVQTIPFPKEAIFVVASSGEKHALVDGEYNERRESCEEAARLLGLTSLREIGLQDLFKRKGELPDLVYRRALHVVGETDRVQRAVTCLRKNDLTGFGRLLDESQESSRINFENSIPSLDNLCEASKKSPGHLGARLSGGGFGGSTLHLIEADRERSFLDAFLAEAQGRLGQPASHFVTRPA